MPRAVLNVVLVIVFVATVVLSWVLRPQLNQPNIEYFPDMAHSPRYNAFAANPVFADGKTLQAPAPGTIPRGMLPLHFVATPQDALRAAEELSSPFRPSDTGVRERGAFVYANFCQTCHDAQGRGDGMLRGYPPPPSLLAEKAVKMKDGKMFHVITFGQGNMPSYASQVSRHDRWAAIAYVRSLQGLVPLPAATPSHPSPANAQPSATMRGGQ